MKTKVQTSCKVYSTEQTILWFSEVVIKGKLIIKAQTIFLYISLVSETSVELSIEGAQRCVFNCRLWKKYCFKPFRLLLDSSELLLAHLTLTRYHIQVNVIPVKGITFK